MNAVYNPRVKICCIQDSREAQKAIAAGASALGLVSAMPSGPGVITEDAIANIAAKIPPPIASFLLTSQQESAAIIDQQQRCRVTTLQLVDQVEHGVYPLLRAALPGISLVQVIHVVDESALDEAQVVAPFVDAILLDSGNPSLPVKELGGTGRQHDWAVSRAIREAVDVPIFLAGGLRPSNIAEAIRQVGPFGVDVCSGVRTDGTLDEYKLAQFFRAVTRVVV